VGIRDVEPERQELLLPAGQFVDVLRIAGGRDHLVTGVERRPCNFTAEPASSARN
jgi:hypothetical protein